MDWEFDLGLNGHVALTGALDVTHDREFTLALAFGESQHTAITTLFEALAVAFAERVCPFTGQWEAAGNTSRPLESGSMDGGMLYCASVGLLRALEDKTCPGALIASLSVPWGEAKGDEDQGGYHLVWTRDLVHSATALLAAGRTDIPLRALVYLAASQQPDGAFAQNFFIHGEPYWRGIQLDQVAFFVLLARQLRKADALQHFDPYPTVMRAARYLVCRGPATDQERWEEASGYSPSTLASNIAALVCAACFARERLDEETAVFLEQYADSLEQHVDRWTMTTEGTLVPGITRHYMRILPVDVRDPAPTEDPNGSTLGLRNVPPGHPWEWPAKEIVDGGFLELVRYGIRRADDPVVVDSIRVIDAVLKVDTPIGSSWHRYNHDGYGQRDDGGPYPGGRAWPLLTGERGHYEVAAGRDPAEHIHALEKFASPTGLLPEQVWDAPIGPNAVCTTADRPVRRCRSCGRMPSSSNSCALASTVTSLIGLRKWRRAIATRTRRRSDGRSGNPTGRSAASRADQRSASRRRPCSRCDGRATSGAPSMTRSPSPQPSASAVSTSRSPWSRLHRLSSRFAGRTGGGRAATMKWQWTTRKYGASRKGTKGMDWSTLISVTAVFAFVSLMMRACGGMMAGGGCGKRPGEGDGRAPRRAFGGGAPAERPPGDYERLLRGAMAGDAILSGQ